MSSQSKGSSEFTLERSRTTVTNMGNLTEVFKTKSTNVPHWGETIQLLTMWEILKRKKVKLEKGRAATFNTSRSREIHKCVRAGEQIYT